MCIGYLRGLFENRKHFYVCAIFGSDRSPRCADVGCRLALFTDINIKAEILGMKYVSSRCDWGCLTTKPSLETVTELRASWGLIKKGKYKANKIKLINRCDYKCRIVDR